MSNSRAAEPTVGSIHTLNIERLADAGRAVAHLPDGRICFVRGVDPGAVATVRLRTVKRRFAEAELIERVQPGPHAVEPFCALQSACGGCPWQGVARAAQAEALHAHVERLLTRAVGQPVTVRWHATDPEPAWRSTARLHWQDGRLGYHQARSRSVLDVPGCPILAPPLPALLDAAREHLPLHDRGTLRLTARPGAASGTVWIDARRRSAALMAGAKALLSTSVCHGVALRDGPAWGDAFDRLGPDAIPHPTGSFVQAHQPGNAILVQTAVAACGAPTAVLELFAGAGNFSFALAAAGHQVQAIEIDAAAAQALSDEAERRGLAVQARAGDARRLPRRLPKVALIDPPRAGAAEAVAALHAAGLERLVYVACAPATLARDVGWLVKRGWRVEAAHAFDLFPHTGHVEALAILERRCLKDGDRPTKS